MHVNGTQNLWVASRQQSSTCSQPQRLGSSLHTLRSSPFCSQAPGQWVLESGWGAGVGGGNTMAQPTSPAPDRRPKFSSRLCPTQCLLSGLNRGHCKRHTTCGPSAVQPALRGPGGGRSPQLCPQPAHLPNLLHVSALPFNYRSPKTVSEPRVCPRGAHSPQDQMDPRRNTGTWNPWGAVQAALIQRGFPGAVR